MPDDPVEEMYEEIAQVDTNYLPTQYGPVQVLTGLVAAYAGREAEAVALALFPDGFDNALGGAELRVVHEWLGQVLGLDAAQVDALAERLLRPQRREAPDAPTP